MSHVAASYQAMTVIAEHYRRISGLMRSEFGITYTDLLALTTLLERTASVPTPWLSDYLMLDRKTIWNVLLKLEDLGYVSKTASPDDGRTMLLRLSASGNQAAEDIHRRLSAFIREQFLANLHEDEYFDFMRDTSKKAVDILRGHLVQPSLEESEERPPLRLFPSYTVAVTHPSMEDDAAQPPRTFSRRISHSRFSRPRGRDWALYLSRHIVLAPQQHHELPSAAHPKWIALPSAAQPRWETEEHRHHPSRNPGSPSPSLCHRESCRSGSLLFISRRTVGSRRLVPSHVRKSLP